ncbi:MAG: DUF2271 domain-containing protein, partial [Planctomycetales bacterium]|nr:DUF2271 domain-containing protein [Planctomycetales bacterium]
MNQFFIFALLSIALAPLGWAAETTPKLEANIEIPRLSVSEYHRPYVAVWVQDEQRRVVATLAVWYQQ